jgi:succinate dehydrogenase / fumarate reductase, membrane anchor subunit
MVTQVTNVSRTGLSDWLIQRVSSVILASYLLFIFGFVFIQSPMDFDLWSDLFSRTWMRLFSFLALFSLVLHSWVGIWTVLTDYIKCSCLRLTIQIIVVMLLILCLVWGIQIVWSL